MLCGRGDVEKNVPQCAAGSAQESLHFVRRESLPVDCAFTRFVQSVHLKRSLPSSRNRHGALNHTRVEGGNTHCFFPEFYTVSCMGSKTKWSLGRFKKTNSEGAATRALLCACASSGLTACRCRCLCVLLCDLLPRMIRMYRQHTQPVVDFYAARGWHMRATSPRRCIRLCVLLWYITAVCG